MADSELKLYYFNGRGRAEVARLMMAAVEKKFEDIRFLHSEWDQWEAMMPFHRCPMLIVDGEKFAQSHAINGFLSREFGFSGKTNMEQLRIDQVVGLHLVEDIFQVAFKSLYITDKEEKAAKIAVARKEATPRFLRYLERLLEENGTGYFVGDRLTLADFAVFDVQSGLAGPWLDVSEELPLLREHTSTFLRF